MSTYQRPGRSFLCEESEAELVVPNRAGITREGDRISTSDRLYESMPSRLWSQPFLPEKPSVITQQLPKPRLLSVLATIFAMSEYLYEVEEISDCYKGEIEK